MSNHTIFAMREHAGPVFSPAPQPVPELTVGLGATEVPYTLADRHAGESRGTLREGLTYPGSLADLRLGGGA